REELREIRAGHPSFGLDDDPLHLRDDGVDAANRKQRKQHEVEEKYEQHQSARIFDAINASPTATGSTMSSGIRSNPAATKQPAMIAIAAGFEAIGFTSLIPVPIKSPAAATPIPATIPRTSGSDAYSA